MNKSVHTVLSPLLIVNYVFGLKIVQLPTGHLRLWFGPFCIPLLWLIYYFLRVYVMAVTFDFDIYVILDWLYNFMALLSILFGMYHNKQFRNCLKKLTIVDTTLEKLGIKTNYQQLRKKVTWIILGWSVTAILVNNLETMFIKKVCRCNAMTAIYLSYLLNHSTHINLLGDLTMTSIIGYVGLKFDQINKHLRNMANNNKYGTTQAWNNTVLHTSQRQFAKFPSNKWTMWIIIQLHLELRKISRELDSIYGEMTFKMGCYFISMAIDFNNIFHAIFFHSYTNQTILYAIVAIFWCSHNILKLLVINLICEKVSKQANSTKNFLNNILQSMKYDVETYENISQLLLHIKQSPLRFCGIGLFQFGNKFIYGFVSSVGTVLVILIQAHTQSENIFKKFQL